MDSESSNKFIGSLTKFLQSLCNGYVEFDDGVELIGHIYLSVDAGKSGKTLNYFLNEKVCKNDNSVTFISNSFHAQPEAKSKASSGKEGDSRKEDGDFSDSGDNIPKSTNAGTISSRAQMSSRSAPSPNQNRIAVQIGTKRPGSPMKGPAPSQRRAHSPSQRRIQSSAARGAVGSPASKTVPSSPSSSSQDNIPSPSTARKSRNEIGQPTSNQSDNVSVDNEGDIVPPNVLSINPTAEFASFLGSLTSDNQTSQEQSSPPDMKPDTDVTFIKEEFVSEPSSCAQTGSSGQHSGRSGEDSSGLYPVMLHQNTSVFPSTSAGYPSGYQGGASATATSGFPGTSTSQSDPFNPVPGTSQDGADPSGFAGKCCPNRKEMRHQNMNDAQSNVKRSDNSGFHPSQLGRGRSGSWTSNTSDQTVKLRASERGGPYHVKADVHSAVKGTSLISSQLEDQAMSGSGIQGCGVPCCTGNYTNCPCGCQSYSIETQMNLDPVQLEQLRQKCTCSCCGLKFHNPSNLRRHQKKHFNIYRHNCSVCGLKFSRSDTMKLHMRRKHNFESS